MKNRLHTPRAVPGAVEDTKPPGLGIDRGIRGVTPFTRVVSKLRATATRAPWLAVLITALVIPNVVWITRDHTAWAWDQAWYGEVSVDLWFNLTHSMTDWGGLILHGLYMKPPGIVWIGQFFVPLGSLFGSIETAILFSIILTQATTLYLIFKIGRCIAPTSGRVPVLGICLAASTQSFVGLSHQFLVEPLQALSVAWIILIALRGTEWPIPRVLLHLGAALIVGMLAKATTPLYCLMPVLYILGVLIHRRPWQGQGWKNEWRSPSARTLGAFIAFATPITAAWYAVNLNSVWQHIRDSSSGEIAVRYGFQASIGRKLIVWLRLLDQSFLSPYLGFAVILAAMICFVAYLGSGGKCSLKRFVIATAILSTLQCGLLLLIFSASVTVDARYMYAMLPLLLVVIMCFCAQIKSRVMFVVIFVICLLQFSTVHSVALGAASTLIQQLDYLAKPYDDRSRFSDVQGIVGLTSTVSGRYNIVGVEEPWLNANTVSFFAAKHRLDTGIRSYFTSLGYAQSNVAGATKRLDDFKVMYYITLDEKSQTIPPNFLNTVSLPMLNYVKMDSHFEQVGPPSSNGVLTFRSH